MSGNLSTWALDAVIDWLMGGANPTRPTGYVVSAHTGDPGATGANNEVGAGVGYARQAATFPASAAGATSNLANIIFGPASGAGFGNVSHFAVWDTGAGNCIWRGPRTGGAVAVPAGMTLTIVAGDLDLAQT